MSSSSPCVHAVKGSRYALRSAMVNSCRSSRGPWTTVGDGRNDEAPGCGRMDPSESESGVVGVVCPGSRAPCIAPGARGRGGGSRSSIDSGRASGLWSLASRCAALGGDKAGMYQVDDVSSGRPRIRAGDWDLSVEGCSVMMRGRNPCLEFLGALGVTTVSVGRLRSVIKAKFRVSKAVATWDARTLSTATRLFTNSADKYMATDQTTSSTQAKLQSDNAAARQK